MTTPIEPEQKKTRVLLALLLAFIPSVCLLVALGVFSYESNAKLVGPWVPGVATALTVICVVCCFTSSFILFQRKTFLAIFLGILFLLLNSVISFGFGCTAFLSGLH